MLTDIKHNCITIVLHNYKTRNTLPQYFKPHCVNRHVKALCNHCVIARQQLTIILRTAFQQIATQTKLNVSEYLYLYPSEVPEYSLIGVH